MICYLKLTPQHNLFILSKICLKPKIGEKRVGEKQVICRDNSCTNIRLCKPVLFKLVNIVMLVTPN